MSDKLYNVLFLCTANSARSVMAEALLTTMSKGQFRGFSAGSFPSGGVHSMAVDLIASSTSYPVENLRSKSWDEFAGPESPQMDFIITVCDQVAGEVCPFWPGHPLSAHWSFEDPTIATGSEDHKRVVFHNVFRQILMRINLFIHLPRHMLDSNVIKYKTAHKNSELLTLT